MKNLRMAKMIHLGPMPFDVKRMLNAGFEILVDA